MKSSLDDLGTQARIESSSVAPAMRWIEERAEQRRRRRRCLAYATVALSMMTVLVGIVAAHDFGTGAIVVADKPTVQALTNTVGPTSTVNPEDYKGLPSLESRRIIFNTPLTTGEAVAWADSSGFKTILLRSQIESGEQIYELIYLNTRVLLEDRSDGLVSEALIG